MVTSLSFIPLCLHGSLPFALAVMGGISWHYYYSQASFYFFLPLFSITILGTAAFFKRKKTQFFTLLVAGFIAGAGTLNIHLKKLASYSFSEPISIKGTIQRIEKTGNYYWPNRLTVKAQTINQKYTNPFSFFIYTKQMPELQCNDTINCKNILIKQPKQKDFKRYIFKEGVAGTAFVHTFEPEIIAQNGYSLNGWLYKKQVQLFASLKNKCSCKTFAFFGSLFMGEKNRSKKILEKEKIPFRQWGISHHLARSGLHLMIFVLLWYVLMSFLPFPYRAKTIILCGLSCIYFFFTPASVSFLRAFSLFMLYKVCNLFDLQIHPIHLIAVVCSATLLYNPFQLFFLDFQLSFYLTFCLAWLAHLSRQKRIYK